MQTDVLPTSVQGSYLDGYEQFEVMVRERVVEATKQQLFTTAIEPGKLWQMYLAGIPGETKTWKSDMDEVGSYTEKTAHSGPRQHYNCNCCKRFIQSYGGLVTIDAEGYIEPALWTGGKPADWPPFFLSSMLCMRKLVREARVNGVFYSSDKVWGIPQNTSVSPKYLGQVWSHLSGVPTQGAPGPVRFQQAEQEIAKKREERGMLMRGMADYEMVIVAEAVRILQSDALYRSEKGLQFAKWLLDLHTTLAPLYNPRRENLVWAAVVTAPPGFCHVKSLVVSTLMDDLKEGLPIATIQRRWAEKLHPTQYQRPSAPPSDQTIKQAEELVEKLGVRKSFDRRFATLQDVIALNKVTIAKDSQPVLGGWMWMPSTPEYEVNTGPPSAKKGGMFDHLKLKSETPPAIELPPKKVTWEKFRDKHLVTAYEVQMFVPYRAAFYGLTTAADPEAPAILQWDGLKDPTDPAYVPLRNPVSHYFYSQGSDASQWNLACNSWVNVNAVFLSPHQWQQPDKFKHLSLHVFFALQDCLDTRADTSGLALFPENLKSEFHGIRSVVEAHSKSGTIQGKELGTANGIAMSKDNNGYCDIKLKVRDAQGWAVYAIDRWE